MITRIMASKWGNGIDHPIISELVIWALVMAIAIPVLIVGARLMMFFELGRWGS